MRKWLIALTIIFGASLVMSATLAGQVFFNGSIVYTDYDKQNLELSHINNIYINSVLPVIVQPTTGEAYVEFNQRFEDILGKNPEFELKVENKGDNCYINFNRTKETDISFIIKEDTTVLTVYLPVQAFEKLQINHQERVNWTRGQEINLTGIDIKTLDINQDDTKIILDGKYENINISSCNSSEIVINSKQKAKVKLQGQGSINLNGLFDTVDLQVSGRVKMNALDTAKVNIDAYNSDIKLEGSYSGIKVLGHDNKVNVVTNTLSDIDIENSEGDVILDGPLNTVKVNNENSNIDIQTTNNPKSIEVLGTANRTTLRLPSNIPGFKVMHIIRNSDYEGYQVEQELDSTLGYQVNSDFTLNKQDDQTYTYGDSSSKLMVQAGEWLRILDNGYTSTK